MQSHLCRHRQQTMRGILWILWNAAKEALVKIFNKLESLAKQMLTASHSHRCLTKAGFVRHPNRCLWISLRHPILIQGVDSEMSFPFSLPATCFKAAQLTFPLHSDGKRDTLLYLTVWSYKKGGALLREINPLIPLSFQNEWRRSQGFGIFSQLLKQLMVMLPQLKNYGLGHT